MNTGSKHTLAVGLTLAAFPLMIFAAINCAGLLLLPLMLPEVIPTYAAIATPLAVNMIGAALALVLMRQRDKLERERQTELHVSEEQLRLTLDAAAMGTWIWEVRADSITWSKHVAQLFGLPAGTCPTTLAAYLGLIHPDDRAAIAANIATALADDRSNYQLVHRVYWPDGRLCWIEGAGRIYRDQAGQPVRLIGTVTDVTARKLAEAERERAEATLVASERRFRALIDTCADAVALFDQHGVVQYVSPAITRVLGYDLDAYVGRNAFAFIHPDDRQSSADRYAQLVCRPGDQATAEVRARHRDGSWRWFEATAVNSLVDPAIAGIVVNIHDVTERKQAEAALRDSEERYRVISELVSDYAFAYRLDGEGTPVLDWVTDAMTRITGYAPEEIPTAHDWDRVTYPEDRPIALRRRQRLHAGQSDVSEYRIIAKDGRLLWLRFYSRPVWDAAAGRAVRIYGAVQDITQIKQLEQQLTQAQKMEAIGRLAGGVAHDFNNLLTVILGSVELLLTAPSETQALREDAEQIRQAAQRAAALIRQLLAFSRQQVLEPRHLDLNLVVRDVGQLLRRLIGEDIKLVTLLAPDLRPVQADPVQLEQVIMNLAINARDAMPAGGTLTIATANGIVGDRDARSDAAQGHFVVLTVGDTGVGMDAATSARIFEPFFTTKGVGQGTGLGLATVHGIVAQSGGQIRVDSAPGYGTTFTICLPCVDDAEEPAGADDPRVTAPAGYATNLLVEDDPQLCMIAARVLREHGYQILEAADGPTALQLAAAFTEPIHLLLTDVIMPGGLSGRQLAEQMIVQRPAIKVLYMSGYAESMMPQTLVPKPFTPDTLARKVWEVLQH
jgi:PAS domain S-box-containing protein